MHFEKTLLIVSSTITTLLYPPKNYQFIPVQLIQTNELIIISKVCKYFNESLKCYISRKYSFALLSLDVFTFDNTYSWLHNKDVEYIVEVLDSHGMIQDPINEQLESLTLTDNKGDQNKNEREKLENDSDILVDIKL